MSETTKEKEEEKKKDTNFWFSDDVISLNQIKQVVAIQKKISAMMSNSSVVRKYVES